VVCKTIYGGSNPPPTSMKSLSTQCRGFLFYSDDGSPERGIKQKDPNGAKRHRDFIEAPPNRIIENNPPSTLIL
jgi:hypothetical protein